MRIVTVPGVFRPISDSWMLARAVRERVGDGDEVLDPFTGSGVLAIAAAQAGARATALDVSRRAVLCARVNARLNAVAIEARRADALASGGTRRFDLIVANPPYVPGPDTEPTGAARAWEGGPDGRRFVDALIDGAPARLRAGGRILIVHSSLLGEGETLRRLTEAGFAAQVVERERGELGPLMAKRLDRLAQLNGDVPPEDEEVLIFEGVQVS
jgi:release factor glutamine methyltransferase